MPNKRTTATPAAARAFDPSWGMYIVLLLDVNVRLLVWGTALALTLYLGGQWSLFPRAETWGLREWGDALHIARRAALLIVVFNLIYLLVLMALRLLVPTPRPGRYNLRRAFLSFNLLSAGLLGTLSRARAHAPFPAFLVPMLGNLWPLRQLLALQFGPRTRSSFWEDPHVLDPYALHIGRNVVIGYNTVISGHVLERDSVLLGHTIIEDDVIIGAQAAISGDVHVKRGAVVGIGAFVQPGTVIGENEFWGGVPARKIKDLAPLD